MRINKFVAQSSNLSRRAADEVLKSSRITVNGIIASLGQSITDKDVILLDGISLTPQKFCTIMLHKPVGYIVSRNGQGKSTIYDLLPECYQHLQPVGRLDKGSSGLLLLTNNGQLAQNLTHPSFNKTKHYDVLLNKALKTADKIAINCGVQLTDGISHLLITGNENKWHITMAEGRNRQIRRTFEYLGYRVKSLHRTNFGSFELGSLPVGKWQIIEKTDII
jgi:23S rRNA pseudouridine2605 synthase